MIGRIVLQHAAIDAMKAEMRRVLLTETGGPMAGYTEGGAVIVTEAAGPGPRARLRPCSVTIDGRSAQHFCAAAYQRSQGRFDYVGDWHCHLGFSLAPSDMDVTAMETMAEFEFSPTISPVSLIWSKWSKKRAGYVYDGEASLRQVSVSCGTNWR